MAIKPRRDAARGKWCLSTQDMLAATTVVFIALIMPDARNQLQPDAAQGAPIYESSNKALTDKSEDRDPQNAAAVAPEIIETAKEVAFPVNLVEWGPGRLPPNGASNVGQLQIWDITGSDHPKIIRLRDPRYFDKGSQDFSSPILTIYMEAGTRGAIDVPEGSYEVLGMSGAVWTGHDFGRETTVVTFGRFTIHAGTRSILAVGATDQSVVEISKNRF